MQDLDPNLLADIRRQLETGSKIDAIKALCDATDLGLKDAKQVVEDLARGVEPGQSGRADRHSSRREPGRGLPADVQGLLRKGQKMEAIKALRDAHGRGLKEASDEVEAFIASRPDLDHLYPKGRFKKLAVVIAIIVAVTAWYVTRMMTAGGT